MRRIPLATTLILTALAIVGVAKEPPATDSFADSVARFKHAEPRALTLVPDPPPAVDGQLEDWAHVPGVMLLNRAEQATWGGDGWKSAADLSAKVWVAWRPDMLYLAAEVTDDQLRQTEAGGDVHKGDHIQFLLDVAPDKEPTRGHFGATSSKNWM